MKKNTISAVSIILAASLLFASCSSSTMIQSNPVGAKLYLNGEAVGTTPYKHTDTKIVGSTTSIKLEKDGYETLNTVLEKNETVNVGAIIGGIFVLFPFLWTMKYNPQHNYEMIPNDKAKKVTKKEDNGMSYEKMTELKRLKTLLDDKILTAEEYEIEKKKLLGQ